MKTILLIDDDEATNVLHKREIKKSNIDCEIIVAINGEEGLEVIKNILEQGEKLPSVIFLDINMPRMNGWEFLDEYEKITEAKLNRNVVVMLTTSLNPDDREKAARFKSICKYLIKPLKRTLLPEVIELCEKNSKS
jgi:response regulator RpfG family c-di-GMP phosphodiesterase